MRQYFSFWREYPDIFVDFLVRGNQPEDLEDETFHFYFYQRIFLRAVMRHQYVYAVFPRAWEIAPIEKIVDKLFKLRKPFFQI